MQSHFGRDTIVALAMLASRMGIQAIVLFSVARFIQAEGYGAFAAVVSLGSLFGPLSGLGADFVAMRTTAQQPEASIEAYIRALRITVSTAIPLLLIAVLIADFAFSQHVSLVVAFQILLADILMFRISELVAKIYQGQSAMFKMGVARLLPALLRLVAIAGLWLLATTPTLNLWAMCYFAGSVAAAVIATVWLFADQKYRVQRHPSLLFNLKDGIHFAGGVISVRLHTEADKALVLSLSSAAGAGIYSAAYRIVELSLLPVAAVVSVAYARLFANAQTRGAASAAASGLRYTILSVTLGGIVSIGIWWLLAPVMVSAVGPSFSAVEEGIVALAALPLAMSLRMTGEQNVAAAGLLAQRSRIQWLAAGAALSSNLVFIPTHGWIAAAWTGAVAEAVLGLVYLGMTASTISQRSSAAA